MKCVGAQTLCMRMRLKGTLTSITAYGPWIRNVQGQSTLAFNASLEANLVPLWIPSYWYAYQSNFIHSDDSDASLTRPQAHCPGVLTFRACSSVDNSTSLTAEPTYARVERNVVSCKAHLIQRLGSEQYEVRKLVEFGSRSICGKRAETTKIKDDTASTKAERRPGTLIRRHIGSPLSNLARR